jgi:hypothetical protein
MNRLAASLCLCAIACGRGTGAAAAAEQESGPTPFAIQFTGTYLGPGALSRLVLNPDGSYEFQLGSAVVQGRYEIDPALFLPLAFQLDALDLVARVTAYDGRLETELGVLQLNRPATADGLLCDTSGGRWTDDDPDPKTGLYCVCAASDLFIPARGGCVPKSALLP